MRHSPPAIYTTLSPPPPPPPPLPSDTPPSPLSYRRTTPNFSRNNRPHSPVSPISEDTRSTVPSILPPVPLQPGEQRQPQQQQQIQHRPPSSSTSSPRWSIASRLSAFIPFRLAPLGQFSGTPSADIGGIAEEGYQLEDRQHRDEQDSVPALSPAPLSRKHSRRQAQLASRQLPQSQQSRPPPLQIRRPRGRAARLWNPVNSSPRDFSFRSDPLSPSQEPQVKEGGAGINRQPSPLVWREEHYASRQRLRQQGEQETFNRTPPTQQSSLGVEQDLSTAPHSRRGSFRTKQNRPQLATPSTSARDWHAEHQQQQTPPPPLPPLSSLPRAQSSGTIGTFKNKMAQLLDRAAGVAHAEPEKDAMPVRDIPSSLAHNPTDLEAGPPKIARATSRASLPGIMLSRRSSTRSHPSTRNASVHSIPNAPGANVNNANKLNANDLANANAALAPSPLNGNESNNDEMAWGPSHPCYPHTNPHVPLSSPLSQSTRIIRIRRDWMIAGDAAPTFANLYPEVLDPIIPEPAFRRLIKHVNDEVMAAYSPWSARNLADAVVGAATLWVWDDLGLAGVKGRLASLERWVDDWSEEMRRSSGEALVSVVPLRRTGYLTLDIQIPDPQIGTDIPGEPPQEDDDDDFRDDRAGDQDQARQFAASPERS